MVFFRVLELVVAHDPVRYQDLHRQPSTSESPANAPAGARAPAEFGAASSEPPVENSRAALPRLIGYASSFIMVSP